tara:strand:+ start:31241 stop:33304 length:2064 start_codon:yes stop_codon:yes gene_type:complete
MAKTILADLVTRMTVESAQFKRELEKTTAKTVAWSKVQQNAANQAQYTNNKMAKSFDNASKSAKKLGGGAITQVGYQVQDFAVQVGGGTNALIAFGQQGSQLAGIFGPTGAVVGAFIAIGSVLGLTLLPEVFKSKDAMNELSQSMERLREVAEKSKTGVYGFTDTIRELSKVGTTVVAAELEASLIRAEKAASAAASSIVEKLSGLDVGYGFSDVADYVEALNADLGFAVSHTEGFRDTAKELGEEFGRTGKAAAEVGTAIIQQLAELQKSPDATRFETLQKYLSDLSLSGDKVSESAKLMVSDLRLFFAEAKSSAEIAEFLSEKLKEIKSGDDSSVAPPDLSLDKSAELIKQLQQELDITKLKINGNELEAIKLANAFSLGKNSISELPNEAQKLLETLYKINQQQEENQKQSAIETRSLSQVESIEKQFAAENDAILAANDERISIIESLQLDEEAIKARGFSNLIELQAFYIAESNELYNNQREEALARDEAEIKREQEKQQRIEEFKKLSEQRQRQGATQNFLSDLQQATANSKKLAGIHKAAAISQAIINTYQAANQALAAPFPPPIPQIFAATAVAAGMANVAAIKSTPIAGARAMGGEVGGGKTYLVGEKGPELFTPGASGQITSNDNLRKAMDAQSQSPSISLSMNTVINGSDNDVVAALERQPRRAKRVLQQLLARPI